ncbi:Tail specific protease [Syntrophomonas zehnderi OL-4]|uniref:Tail specific protease n=1 Tax=Syntrophomonas zehnderi OL-4 TaxID=690567 RepID=A0A0E3WAR2_9FIRM|nr:S41 family peptidase [Syntrophomonas zehnderi]CQB51990.1 Tail specific protease [Syntrophomonas zehnderi OL-4]
MILKDNKIVRGFYKFFAFLGLLVFLSLAFVFITNSSSISSLFAVVGLLKTQSLYEPQTGKMIQGATSGIVSSLKDPYSKYLNKSQWEELKLQLNAEFGGIGVYVLELDGQLGIVSPIKGTPAYRQGLKNGDIIVRINGESAVNMSQDDAVNRMRGEPGTQLNLSIFRPSDGQEHDFKIVREIINVPSVDDKVIGDGVPIGYIKLNQFHAHSVQEIANSLNRLNKKDIKGLILDLRDNGGGDFDASIAIADIFLEDKEIVSAKDARGKEKHHRSEPGSFKLPMVVLVNGNSASAAEILSGALQDNKRAVLVGEKTYGKGLVQTVFPLRDGGALKLTTQKYFTPKGTDINEIGINPDFVVKNPEGQDVDLQLQRAIEVLKEKIM